MLGKGLYRNYKGAGGRVVLGRVVLILHTFPLKLWMVKDMMPTRYCSFKMGDGMHSFTLKHLPIKKLWHRPTHT